MNSVSSKEKMSNHKLTNAQKKEVADFFGGSFEYETTRKDSDALYRMYTEMQMAKDEHRGDEAYCCGKLKEEVDGLHFCSVCGKTF